MKRNLLCIVALALAAVLCTGCGVKDEDLKSDPLVNPDGTAPVGQNTGCPCPAGGLHPAGQQGHSCSQRSVLCFLGQRRTPAL